MLSYVMLSYVMLRCYVMLCYVMLCYVQSNYVRMKLTLEKTINYMDLTFDWKLQLCVIGKATSCPVGDLFTNRFR